MDDEKLAELCRKYVEEKNQEKNKMINAGMIDEGAGGYREGRPVEEIVRKIENFKEKKMSNQGMNETASEELNIRKVFEKILEENRQSAEALRGLVYLVSASLFGEKPVNEKAKESAELASSFFNRAKGIALDTQYCLSETRDELQEIIKELK